MDRRRVLVVAAHSDDETLGCGGTLRRHADLGHDVCAIHLTDGVGARGGHEGLHSEERKAASESAARALGFEWVARGEFPDNRLDGVNLLDVVRFVEEALRRVDPHLVYTHHGGDLNVDHRIAFQATLTAVRPLPDRAPLELRTFEVPSATEWSHITVGPPFTANVFVDISRQWSAKLRALDAYRAELGEPPHPRSRESLDALARLRGAEAGVGRAEAFCLIRRVIGQRGVP